MSYNLYSTTSFDHEISVDDLLTRRVTLASAVMLKGRFDGSRSGGSSRGSSHNRGTDQIVVLTKPPRVNQLMGSVTLSYYTTHTLSRVLDFPTTRPAWVSSPHTIDQLAYPLGSDSTVFTFDPATKPHLSAFERRLRTLPAAEVQDASGHEWRSSNPSFLMLDVRTLTLLDRQITFKAFLPLPLPLPSPLSSSSRLPALSLTPAALDDLFDRRMSLLTLKSPAHISTTTSSSNLSAGPSRPAASGDGGAARGGGDDKSKLIDEEGFQTVTHKKGKRKAGGKGKGNQAKEEGLFEVTEVAGEVGQDGEEPEMREEEWDFAASYFAGFDVAAARKREEVTRWLTMQSVR